MDRKEKRIITVTAVLLVAALIATAVVFFVQKNKNSFDPPPCDKGATSGIPTVNNDALQYRSVKVSEDLSFSLCMCPSYEDGEVKVLLTNDEGSSAYVRIVLFDAEDNTVGESGLIKPGEYVESVSLSITPENDMTLKAKILSYDMKTYYSRGTSDGELKIKVGE